MLNTKSSVFGLAPALMMGLPLCAGELHLEHKCDIVATGAGHTLLGLAGIPGASSWLSSAYVPYSSDAMRDVLRDLQDARAAGMPLPKHFKLESWWMGPSIPPAVSWDSINIYDWWMRRQDDGMQNTMSHKEHVPRTRVIISGALATSRWRRGEDKAFVRIVEPCVPGTPDNVVYELEFVFNKVCTTQAEWDAQTAAQLGPQVLNHRTLQDSVITLVVLSYLLRSDSNSMVEFLKGLHDSAEHAEEIAGQMGMDLQSMDRVVVAYRDLMDGEIVHSLKARITTWDTLTVKDAEDQTPWQDATHMFNSVLRAEERPQ